MKVNLFKIQEGKLTQWLEWSRLLATQYKEEAIETLKEEGLTYEGFSVFKIKEDFYTMAMMEGEAKPANLERELNRKHREAKKECLEFLGKVKMAYELYNK